MPGTSARWWIRALVELGNSLYWDDPEAARAAYQEAVDAGHLPALIGPGMVLRNVLGDEEAGRPAFDRAAASDDPDLPEHGNDPEGAEALYRQAVEAGDADWSANALYLLGRMLASKGDVAGATAAWRRVIGSRSPEWAAPAFVSLVNALDGQGDVDGLRAAYATGAQLGNPEAPYALLRVGQLLDSRGDLDGAHATWRQAIEAECKDPGYWRERMSPSPRRHLAPPYPLGLPAEFDPRNLVRTGLDVLEHGLPPLPDVLTYEMAIRSPTGRPGMTAPSGPGLKAPSRKHPMASRASRSGSSSGRSRR